MDTSKLRKFAQFARRQLHSQVGAQLDRVLNTDSADLRAKAATVRQLQALVRAEGKATVVERVAYTWFNRFCALRYMDVNRYTPVGIVSPQPGAFQPAILEEAKAGIIEPLVAEVVNERAILDLLGGRTPSPDAQGEAYRLLLVGACNAYHDPMPFLFAPIDDYSELLMPDDLLSGNSILAYTREALTPEACENVDVLGWLYQFYISEKKDAVIGSKGKIEAADIPAATQLFTPHWIVRYLVENSLGRLWLATHPHSRLADQMDYYVAPATTDALASDQLSVISDQSTAIDRAHTTADAELTHHASRITHHAVPSEAELVEALRLCDPAAGSGHMLTYAFDLLYAIYEEEGYAPSEIPTRILRHNLYGMEIDERAGALAAFALTMKARSRDRGFLRRGIHPNICVLKPITISTEEVDGLPWLQALAATLDGLPIRDALLADLNRVDQLDNIGSLLRPQLTRKQIARVREAMTAGSDLFTQALHDKLTVVLDQLEYLARKYYVVVANPPYMGSGNQNNYVRMFLQDEYREFKTDLFSAFVVRIMEMTNNSGLAGIMTPFTWMFINSYEKLREHVLNNSTLVGLVRPEYHAFFESAYVPICAFILSMKPEPEYKGAFIDLTNFYGAELQPVKALEAIHHNDCGWFYRASTVDFRKIPGSPLAYWISADLRDSFLHGTPFAEIAEPRKGITTADNETYLRLWYEVELSGFETAAKSNEGLVLSEKKWFPLNKGGNYRKWYGNKETVIFWQNNGAALKNFKNSVIRNATYYFREGMTWNDISSGRFAMRYSSNDAMFEGKGPMAFARNQNELVNLIGFFNSKVASSILAILCPTLNFNIGEIARTPIFPDTLAIVHIKTNAFECIKISQSDWDAYETSWDFTTLPLLDPTFRGPTLAATYANLRGHWQAMTDEMQQLEEANNRLFIDAYGLQDELTPDVPLAEITLTCNPHYRYSGNRTPAELEALLLADTMREFISYAVGCLFGRYSLDKPGLILANHGETVGEFVGKVFGGSGQSSVSSHQLSVDSGQSDGRTVSTDALNTENCPLITDKLLPDADNVIPILDEGDWFVDDLCARVQGFLRLTFGEKNYAENLRFIEAALGRDLRGYLLRDFYNDHVRRYQKRPIYWLFSSANGSFNALIYLHRYRPDTPSVVLNDYLREFRTKLTAESDHQAVIAIDESAPARERTRAQKQLDRFAKILAELQEYEDEVLYPLATQQIALDLDDGVKVNYNKLGKALKKVSGLSE